MIYSAKILGGILRQLYDNAPRNEQVTMIHLFGIKYGEIIKANKIKAADIVREAEMNDSYKTEISKAINLSKYACVKDSVTVFDK